MITFISGGAKSGKSHYALQVAASCGAPRYYVATMIPRDSEDEARIARHRAERDGWGFETLACGRDILSCLECADPGGVYLVDSVTALLANNMFPPEGFRGDAHVHLTEALEEFLRRAPNTVLVSDDIFSDALLYDPLTEAYRAGLARIARRLAMRCDNVIEVAAGQIIVHKGALPL